MTGVFAAQHRGENDDRAEPAHAASAAEAAAVKTHVSFAAATVARFVTSLTLRRVMPPVAAILRPRPRDVRSPAATRRPFRPAVAIAVCFAVALIAVFCLSIDERFGSDENVFVASGALMRQGILPYRDYHYNHVPTLVILYSFLFRATSHLLLAARAFSAVCSAITVTALFAVALKSFATLEREKRLLLAAGAAALFVVDPLFTDAAGLAWNHNFPLMTCVLGFLALRHALASCGDAGDREADSDRHERPERQRSGRGRAAVARRECV